MGEIKSAYEIAMEKARDIDAAEGRPAEEDLKPLLAKFFRDRIDADELWQELKDNYDEGQYVKAQEMLVDSLGLRNTSEQFTRRKEGVLAIENLKQRSNSSLIEQYLDSINKLQQQYENEREQMEQQMKQRMEQNGQVQMKPVQTEDGRTVMKLESGVDEKTRNEFNKMISRFEEQYSQKFTGLIEELKQKL